MKRQRVRIATAIVATAVLSGCFDDPTSSLRNGPAELRLSRTSAIVPVSDSVLVEANVVDEQGNILTAEGATWTSDDPAIAAVDLAATQLPANGSSRAYIKGVASLGGITTVRVTIRGVSDSVRVIALPNVLFGATGLAVVTGTPTPDTTAAGIIGGCAGANAGVECFSAGDTLTVTAATGTTFDPASSVVTLGGVATQLLSRTSTTIKALANRAHNGRVTVTNVTWTGNATTGDILLTSLDTPDSIKISRVRMRGTVTVTASALGPNTEMKITPGPGTTFSTTAGALSTVVLGGVPAVILQRTVDSIKVFATAPYTGGVKVTNINLPQPGGPVRLDSLVSGANSTIAGGYFPGTVTSGTDLLDTIFVTAPAGITFATNSAVTINGTTAFMVSRSSTVLKVIAQSPGLGIVGITNVIGPVWTYSTLSTSAPLLVNSQTTDEANEPGNDDPATATTFTGPVNVNDTVTITGAVHAGADIDDFFKFTTVSAGSYRVVVDWAPAGIDIDAFILNAGGGGFCVIDGCGAATGADPETANGTLAAATTYQVYVNLYDNHNLPTPISYRIRVIRRT